MSIPLERLYNYIENVARDICNNDVIIYGFYPHGSKKVSDLKTLLDNNCNNDWVTYKISPQIYCHDQEPLNYDYYQEFDSVIKCLPALSDICTKYSLSFKNNIRYAFFNVYDKCILLHSEKNSNEVIKYQNDQFIPVYFWSHAIIARDWFRYAQHVGKTNGILKTKTFLIYNRAWSGTREYRLKLIDLLIDYNIISKCKTTINPIEPELQIHYQQHQYQNSSWKPHNQLENFLSPTNATSCSSANFDISDYNSTDIEIVLETLFDDPRIQLTEKILRPIACGHPFMLVGTSGSLQYLRDYGFKTFNGIIDESYDTITNNELRLQAIVNEMQRISSWTSEEKIKNLEMMNKISQYNRQYFFSNEFSNLVTSELQRNLKAGLEELENTNTGLKYINLRKQLATYPEGKNFLILDTGHTRDEILKVIKTTRTYYNRYLKTLNK